MVSVAKYHSLHFVHNRICPYGVAPRNALSADTVAFHIALVHNIEAVFVAQLIEKRVVGIVRSAYRVYIAALHYVEILIISLFGNRPTVVGVEIVAVCAANHQRLTVKENFLSDYFNLFKSEAD